MSRPPPASAGLWPNDWDGNYPCTCTNQQFNESAVGGLIPEMDTDSLTAILGGAGYEMARMIVDRKNKKPEEAAAFATQFFLNGLKGFSNPAKETQLIRRGPLKLGGAAR